MDDSSSPAATSTQYQAHNPQERWESGDEKGPRIVVRPGREFVPPDALGRQRVDPNATVAHVRVGAGKMWAGGSMLPGVMAAGCIGSYCGLHLVMDGVGIGTWLTVALSLLGTFVVAVAVLTSVNLGLWQLLLTPNARLALQRSSDPAWLVLLCRAPWTRKLASRGKPNGGWFDVRRWQTQLGPAAPRIVLFDVELPPPVERMALGEPLNSLEREKPSRRMVWLVGVWGVLLLPAVWLKLISLGLGPTLGVIVGLALVAILMAALLSFRAAFCKLGIAACRFEPGKVTVVDPRGERVYAASSSVITVSWTQLGQACAYVVDSSGRADLVFVGAGTSTEVLAEIAARWVLRPLEADSGSQEEVSRG